MPSAYKKVGNVPSAVVNISSQVIGKENKFVKLEDVCSRIMVEGITLDINLNCASSDNLRQALFSDKFVADSSTDTKDFCIDSLETGMFFPFAKSGAQLAGLQVFLRDALGNLVKELFIDVDFSFSLSGIILLQDIAIEDAVTLRLYYPYDNAGIHEFDFLNKYIGYKSLYFKGVNYNTDELHQFDCEFHKVLFTPINTFDLISRDEFFTLQLTATVEKDNGSWFRITKQET